MDGNFSRAYLGNGCLRRSRSPCETTGSFKVEATVDPTARLAAGAN
jgi:hypothetical protein